MGGGRECGMDLSGYGSGPLEKTIKLRVPENRRKIIDYTWNR